MCESQENAVHDSSTQSFRIDKYVLRTLRASSYHHSNHYQLIVCARKPYALPRPSHTPSSSPPELDQNKHHRRFTPPGQPAAEVHKEPYLSP